MKALDRIALASALLACSGVALGESGSLDQFRPKVLPVLVQVNSHGLITDASPSIPLSPALSRLLRKNLAEMITKPATDKHGHPVSSQFIINLAVQATSAGKDKFETHFVYVSTSPVPAGSWYWVHIDGRRLALAPQGWHRPQPRMFDQYNGQPVNQNSSPSTPAPARATDTHSSPAPSPAQPPGRGK